MERKKLLWDLMIHVYEEDERRNELIDSKNSQMIVLTGVMLSLQVTLFSNLYITTILKSNILCFWKGILAIIMLVSFLSYGVSMGFFIWAYAFQDDYFSVPKPESLIKYNESSVYDTSRVIDRLLDTFNRSIKFNDETMELKVEKGTWGFRILVVGGFLTLLFIFMVVFLLYPYLFRLIGL